MREELIRQGHAFKSRTDTEVVLHAFREWGEGMPRSLRGMFAFAIYDGKSDRVTLVRDRYGKKPLYYMLPGRAPAVCVGVEGAGKRVHEA